MSSGRYYIGSDRTRWEYKDRSWEEDGDGEERGERGRRGRKSDEGVGGCTRLRGGDCVRANWLAGGMEGSDEVRSRDRTAVLVDGWLPASFYSVSWLSVLAAGRYISLRSALAHALTLAHSPEYFPQLTRTFAAELRCGCQWEAQCTPCQLQITHGKVCNLC